MHARSPLDGTFKLCIHELCVIIIAIFVRMQLSGSGTTSFSDCMFYTWDEDKKV